MGLKLAELSDLTVYHRQQQNLCMTMEHEYARPPKERMGWRPANNGANKDNHSVRDDGGNYGRTIPVEKPLEVIINRPEGADQNGRSFPAVASSKIQSAPFALLQEDFTKNTMQVVHGGRMFPPSAPSSSTSVASPFSIPSAPSTSIRPSGRQEEVFKRKTTADKFDKIRESNKLEFFVPQCDGQTSTQLGMLIRRYGKRPNVMPPKMKEYVMDDLVDGPSTSRGHPVEFKKERLTRDPDETDYDDMDKEEPPLSGRAAGLSCSAWDQARMQAGLKDQRLLERVDLRQKDVDDLTMQLAFMERTDDDNRPRGEGDEGCARLRPWDGNYRRKLIRTPATPIFDHYTSRPSTSRDIDNLHDRTVSEVAAQYLHRISVMPPMVVRKRRDKCIWLNTKEMDEEKVRNGGRRREEREKREKRKLERREDDMADDRSDSYEDTDESDTDYDPQIMPDQQHRKSSVNGVGKKRKKERRERRARKLREGANPPLPLSKVGRRQSVGGAPNLLYGRLSSNSRNSFERLDDIPFEPSVLNLPQKIEYKEICIPSWRKIEEGEVEDDVVEKVEEGETITTGNGEMKTEDEEPKKEEGEVEEEDDEEDEDLMMQIARQHHPLEIEERRRFQAFRESQNDGTRNPSKATTVSKASKTSKDPTRERAVSAQPRDRAIPPFDYSRVKAVKEYERISVANPYPPRPFQ